MSIVHLSYSKATPIKGGAIKPDENGYYTVTLGGLNCYNSYNAYYDARGALKLFEESSAFMRRIRSGYLGGECGHPVRIPGMSDDEWMRRALTIDEKHVTFHIADVWLDMDYGKKNPQHNNPKMIGIIGRIRPKENEKGNALKGSLENPEENVAFSIRSITRDEVINGQLVKTLVEIVTWDQVTEPGINQANKWNTVSSEAWVLQDSNVSTMDSSQMSRLLKLKRSNGNGLSFESSSSPFIDALCQKLDDLTGGNKGKRLSSWR